MRSVPVMCFFNNKGGVGKSTVTMYTAIALAEKGKPVVIIDMDSQTNITTQLMLPDGKSQSFDFSHILSGSCEDIFDCVAWATKVPDVHVSPSDTNLKAILDQTIAKEKGIEKCIKRFKAAIDGLNDMDEDIRPAYIIIDLPPTIDSTVKVALSYMTHMYFVIDDSSWSEDGIVNFLASQAYKDSKAENPDLKIVGAVYNRLDTRTGNAQIALTRTEIANGIPVLDTYIPDRSEVKTNVNTGNVSLRPYGDKKSRISAAFDELADHVISNVSM